MEPKLPLGIKPTMTATMYPATIPKRKGITLKKPFALMETNAIIIIVEIATIRLRQSYVASPAKNPAFPTALPASPNPITIIVGPITIGGSNLFNHLTPTNLIIIATII